MSDEPIVLLKGSDQILLADAAGAHLASMLGERDRDEVVDQFGGDEYELTDAVLAASAVSMFGDRVIVMRNAGRFNAEACLPLVNYAADPNPTSQVLVVWERPLAPSGRANAVPKKLSDAIKACGGAVVDCDVGSNAKARQGWLDKHLAASSVSSAWARTCRASAGFSVCSKARFPTAPSSRSTTSSRSSARPDRCPRGS